MILNDGPAPATEADDVAGSSAAVARGALEHWQWAVRGRFLTASSDEARTALRGLAGWYERICVDETYHTPAPAEGIDALMAEGARPDHLFLRSEVVTYWAVRVAQELAEWRRPRSAAVGADAVLLADAKLDLALRGAFDRFMLDQPAHPGAHAPKTPLE